MKTSEFIEKLDKHKGKFLMENIFSDDELYLTSIKTNQFNITFYHDAEPDGIIDIIAEYLNTPVRKREEEKKYYLKQKGVAKKYLIYLNELSEYTTGVYPYENENVKTDFTQEEIDNMPECYTHPEVWEQILVEE